LYEAFLEEVIQKYKQALHPVTGEPLIRIVGTPGAEDAYVWFNVGEGPVLPYRSEYFLRFSSKLVRRDDVMPYLKVVYLIARQYFPNNVQFWVAGALPGLIRVLDKIPNMKEEEGGCHSAEDVYKAMRKMKGLEEEDQSEEHKLGKLDKGAVLMRWPASPKYTL
jgi:hypothetical protein